MADLNAARAMSLFRKAASTTSEEEARSSALIGARQVVKNDLVLMTKAEVRSAIDALESLQKFKRPTTIHFRVSSSWIVAMLIVVGSSFFVPGWVTFCLLAFSFFKTKS